MLESIGALLSRTRRSRVTFEKTVPTVTLMKTDCNGQKSSSGQMDPEFKVGESKRGRAQLCP